MMYHGKKARVTHLEKISRELRIICNNTLQELFSDYLQITHCKVPTSKKYCIVYQLQR